MAFLQYTLGQDDLNRRLDRILKNFLPKDFPLSKIYKALRTGKIKINGKKAKPDYRILENDCLFIDENLFSQNDFSNQTELKNQAECKNQTKKNDSNNSKNQNSINHNSKSNELKIELEIIFENEYVKAINKPYNIPVQKAKNEVSLDDLIKKSFIPKNDSLSFKPGPLHRLDKKTTGLLFFSNNLLGAQEFSKLIQNHELTKTYLTIVEGKVTSSFVWEDSLQKEDNFEKSFKTVKIATSSEKLPKSKTAITKIIPIKCGKYKNKDITFCEVQIYTGRTHQIRSQCAFHGFPLLGDTAYNKNAKPISKEVEFFLHAYKIVFPEYNKIALPKEIVCPLPKNFDNFVKTFLKT